MKTVIKVKNVQKTYDKRVILKQVDLEIKKGEIVALLGRNGAGKSTLLNVLLQLVSKDQGEIEILGEKRLKTEAIGGLLAQTHDTNTVNVLGNIVFLLAIVSGLWFPFNFRWSDIFDPSNQNSY